MKGEKNGLIGSDNLVLGDKNLLLGDANTIRGTQNIMIGHQNAIDGNLNALYGMLNQLQQDAKALGLQPQVSLGSLTACTTLPCTPARITTTTWRCTKGSSQTLPFSASSAAVGERRQGNSARAATSAAPVWARHRCPASGMSSSVC